MVIQIITLLICVTLLIISLCILSYLKIIFERSLLKEDDYFKVRTSNQDLEMSMDDTLADIKSLLDKLISDVRESDNKFDFRIESLMKSFDSLKNQSPVADNVIIPYPGNDITENNNVNVRLSNSERVAYEDSTTAFQKVNNELYSIRKHKDIVHELFNVMYNGSGNLNPVLLNDLTDSDREIIVTVFGKIKNFNENYRPFLTKGLTSLGLSFDSCVRFPLNQPFDNSWDENNLGYDVDDGTIIKRVVSLGYEFPESPIIGRQKSKIM